MSDNLSAKNLVSCLHEKDKYKGTLVYLQQVHKFNEKVYDIFNQALEAVLLSKHNNYMAKLLSLRLFKEIVLTGNFTLIDGLNEKIEEQIVKIVQYNKKSKEINRGANYFIQVQKIKKDADIQKVGSSYVLLAGEILMALAKWYPVDEDGVKSRFAQWYEKLLAAGVPFHDFNFFKKEDEEKFKNNYQKWIKWYLDQVREQEVEETTKQIKPEELAKDRLQPAKEKENKQEAKYSGEANVGQPIQHQSKVQLTTKKVQKPLKSELVEQKIVQPQSKRLTIPENTNSLSSSHKLEEKIKQLEAKLERITNENNYLQSKHDKDLNLLKMSKEQIENKLILANRLVCQQQLQSQKMKQEIESKEQIILDLQNLVANFESREARLQQSNGANNPKIAQKIEHKLETQCYNIKVTPPREYQLLQEQNDILTQAIEKAEEHFIAKRKELQDQLAFTKEQNKRLNEEIALKTKQMQLQRSKQSVEQEFVRNIIREDSLLVEDQPKVLYKPQPLSNTMNQPRSYEKPAVEKCSVSEYLRANSKMKISQNVEIPAEVRPRSLKKTESQHRMKTNKDFQGFSITGFSNECKAVSGKLTKTTSNFSHRLNLETNNNVVTYFPFLEDYFQSLPDPNPIFKKYCLLLQPEKGQFFQNQLIKASITKTNQTTYLLHLFNNTSNELKIKVLSGHYSLKIEGEKNKKILGGTIGSFAINFQKLDFNLRYPIVSIVIGNQRISLTSTTPHEKNVHLALPLTLLDFCTVYREKERQWISSTKISKYCSDKLAISRLSSTLQECLPFFKIVFNRQGLVAKGGLDLVGMQDTRVLIQVEQNQADFWVGVWFRSDSSNGSNFAKVIMQVLLYLLQR